MKILTLHRNSQNEEREDIQLRGKTGAREDCAEDLLRGAVGFPEVGRHEL